MLLFGDDSRRRVSFCSFAKALFKIPTFGDTACENNRSGCFHFANIRDRTTVCDESSICETSKQKKKTDA